MALLFTPQTDRPAQGLHRTAEALQAVEELLQQASASRPPGRKTLTLTPAAVRGLRTLLALCRGTVEEIGAVVDHDPCSRTYYDILTHLKRFPHAVTDLIRVLDAADETGFTNWPMVRRVILQMHAEQAEARRQLAQQIQDTTARGADASDTPQGAHHG